uniref:CCHC-type domain-containing protein n=1 Tax=Cyclopterus lumpus TaxID=8103 RepID=A0A8C3G017_CYCLU
MESEKEAEGIQNNPRHVAREWRCEERGARGENWQDRERWRDRDFGIRPRTRDFVCHQCGKNGHWRKDCPQAPWNKRRTGGRNRHSISFMHFCFTCSS